MNEIINLSDDINKWIILGFLRKLKQLDSEKFSKANPIIITKLTGINQQSMDNKILTALTMIVNEVAQNENVDISDLEFVDRWRLCNSL